MIKTNLFVSQISKIRKFQSPKSLWRQQIPRQYHFYEEKKMNRNKPGCSNLDKKPPPTTPQDPSNVGNAK